MRVLDSRRLTGPNLLLDGPGAILDVATEGTDAEVVAGHWSELLRGMLNELRWNGETIASRRFPGGISLAFTAPIDALYAATEVNEWAIEAVERTLRGAPPEDRAAAAELLRESAARERKPPLIELAHEAARRSVSFISDTKRASVGLGTGSRSWPLGKIPTSATRVRWQGIHDVPIALVTGTNGKTTTVRLLGAMAHDAGKVAGVTSTDRVDVGEETVAVGDYSGPNGARTVLRDRRVEVAFLEVARGGILRRGLPVRHADAALVTNVANDHLGEFGIFDLDALADAKMVVAKAVSGRVVLNADDPRLLARGLALDRPVTWFSLDPRHRPVVDHVAQGGDACVLEDDVLVLHRRGERHAIAPVADVPIACGGAARYNIANALGAMGVASALRLPLAAIAETLTRFDNSAAINPGRTNQWDLNGVRVIVDFAHNPHGIRALAEMAATVPAARRGLVLGQAGDRDDASIAEFAGAAWTMRPDRVFIKEMEKYRRGREAGVVPELIERELRRGGAAAAALSHHESELDAVRAALVWARPGDLLLLTVHTDRDTVIALVEDLARSNWNAGEALAARPGERRP